MKTGNKRDFEYVQKAERDRIDAHRTKKQLEDRDYFVGLSISGGGIRSASFGLGVLQGLNRSHQLKNVDYLSTVSGGGYIGSSLTWFTHRSTKDKAVWKFPYGKRGRGVRSGRGKDLLDFIRQHGNYLKPGDGLSTASLAATALRNMSLSFAVYFGLLIFFVFALIDWKFLPPPADSMCVAINTALYSAIFIAGVLVVLIVVYGLGTFVASGKSSVHYWLRVQAQIIFGFVLAIGIVLAIIGSLPIVTCQLGVWTKAVGGISAAIGSAGGVYEFIQRRKSTESVESPLSALRLWITAFLLAYGLLLLAYTVAAYFNGLEWSLWDTALRILLPSLLLGLLVNTNYFGIGRMYRDRLMETFMPDPEAVESGQWSTAKKADRAKLSEMCGADERGPYHLVNCNIVLVDSEESEYRARGGDSFLLSPLACGSDATAWYDTKEFMDDGMTLATAMAISGAAANPNTGVAGGGPTRNRLVSFLMAFVNLRLGYFAQNPNAEGIRRIAGKLTPPSLIYPGIVQGLLGQRLHAHAGYIELSDGGHFENTGIYELVRRRVDVIIASEAGADPHFTMSDLANAVERVKVDFGYYIDFDPEYSLNDLLPGSSEKTVYDEKIRLAKRGFAIGTIDYGDKQGTIIFIKATLTDDLPADIYAYRKTNNDFPNQSTADQFFDEVQLEAYRELGYRLCKALMNTNKDENKGWLRPPGP